MAVVRDVRNLATVDYLSFGNQTVCSVTLPSALSFGVGGKRVRLQAGTYYGRRFAFSRLMSLLSRSSTAPYGVLLLSPGDVGTDFYGLCSSSETDHSVFTVTVPRNEGRFAEGLLLRPYKTSLPWFDSPCVPRGFARDLSLKERGRIYGLWSLV